MKKLSHYQVALSFRVSTFCGVHSLLVGSVMRVLAAILCFRRHFHSQEDLGVAFVVCCDSGFLLL